MSNLKYNILIALYKCIFSQMMHCLVGGFKVLKSLFALKAETGAYKKHTTLKVCKPRSFGPHKLNFMCYYILKCIWEHLMPQGVL